MKLVIPGIVLVIALLAAMLITMPPARSGPTREVIARAEVDSIFRAGLRARGGLDPGVERIATGVSRRARLAWVAAELVGSSGDGPEVRQHIRRTALFARIDGEWQREREDGSRGVEQSDLERAAGPRAVPDTTGDGIGRGCNTMVRRFRKLVASPTSAKVSREACAIGPLTGEFAVGDSAVRALLADAGRRWGPLRLIPGSVTARRLRDGAGWVTGIAEARPPGSAGAPVYLRFVTVWRMRGEDGWDLALAHVSVAALDAASVRASTVP